MRSAERTARTLLALAWIVVGGTAVAGTALPDILFADGFEDVQAIQTTVGTVALGEAGTGTFGARLVLQPPGNVSVTVESSDTSAAMVSPAVLDFTSSDYSVYQTVTVSGVEDPDSASESVTVTLASPDIASRLVTANVTDNDYTLSVDKTGSGYGTVSGSGIDCGVDCTETYSAGTVVTLSATPSPSSTFSGWGLPCSGMGTCMLTMNAAKSVSADFALDCDATCFVVRFAGDGSVPPSPTSSPVAFSTPLKKADVAFVVDTTASMGGAINNLKNSLSMTIIPALATRIPDVGIGVMGHDDVPTYNASVGGACPVSYGSCNNSIFSLPPDQIFYIPTNGTLRDVSSGGTVLGTGQAQAQTAVNALRLSNGVDLPESQIPALLRAIRGDALSWGASCNCAAGSFSADPGDAASYGALRFRSSALPIVVSISDARSHNGKRPGIVTFHFPYQTTASTLPNADDLVTAINAAGAKFIGVAAADAATADTDAAIRNEASDRSAYGDMAFVSDATSSNVPPSAFTGNTCRTGIGGATVAADGPAGTCRLIFSLRNNGAGLGTSVVDGVAALLNTITLDVYVQAYNDPAETTDVVGNFMLEVEPDPSGGTDPFNGTVCLPFAPAQLADNFTGPKALVAGADGVNDTIEQVNPGPSYCFIVTPKANSVIAATAAEQTFRAWIRVLAIKPTGGTFALGPDRDVLFIVPPISAVGAGASSRK